MRRVRSISFSLASAHLRTSHLLPDFPIHSFIFFTLIVALGTRAYQIIFGEWKRDECNIT